MAPRLRFAYGPLSALKLLRLTAAMESAQRQERPPGFMLA
jgi:hypothetical protein